MTIEMKFSDSRTPSEFDEFEFRPTLVGRGWDEIEVGFEYSDFPDRSMTLTEEVVNQFSALTGDFNPIHLDPDFASKSVYRRRIAHGALLSSVCIGQYHGSGFTYGTTLALLGSTAKYLRPCPVGDEVYVKFVVTGKDENPHPKRGRVSFRTWLCSANDHEPYVEIDFDVLVRRLRSKSALRRLGLEEHEVHVRRRAEAEAQRPRA